MKDTLAILSGFKMRTLRFGIALGSAMILLGLLGAGIGRSVSARIIHVGLVPDQGGISDMAFNWLSYQGLLRAQRELGVLESGVRPAAELF
jgi:basic membrane lipoprotein Med (substrate-binding protein (PBP1-ABC) superfamily)